MSRSNQTERAPSPVEKYFKWSGKEGVIQYYDSATEENVNCDVPFEFVYLDTRHIVTGYLDEEKKGVFSNEVKFMDKEIITVKTSDGVLVKGIYKDIKPDLPKGAKYGQSIYIAYAEGNELKIGNLRVAGSFLSGGKRPKKNKKDPDEIVHGWFTFKNKKNKDIQAKGVAITGSEQCENGAVSFFAPIFQVEDIEEDVANQAIELDKILQLYFDEKQEKYPTERKPEPETNQTTQNIKDGKVAVMNKGGKAANDDDIPSSSSVRYNQPPPADMEIDELPF